MIELNILQGCVKDYAFNQFKEICQVFPFYVAFTGLKNTFPKTVTNQTGGLYCLGLKQYSECKYFGNILVWQFNITSFCAYGTILVDSSLEMCIYTTNFWLHK